MISPDKDSALPDNHLLNTNKTQTKHYTQHLSDLSMSTHFLLRIFFEAIFLVAALQLLSRNSLTPMNGTSAFRRLFSCKKTGKRRLRENNL